MRARLIIALPLAATLAGCMAGPDYKPPAPEAGSQFVRGGNTVPATPAARWWEALGDPQLSQLVEDGLANAPAIAIAQARLRQSRAGLAASRAALMPALAGTAMYVHADLPGNAFGSEPTDFYSVGFDAQWEIDLWGGKRRAVEQRFAQAGAAAAGVADAQVSLSAEIVRSYVVLQARLESIALIQQRGQLEARRESLAAQRLAGGTGTRQELAIARQSRVRGESELTAALAEADVLRDALAMLVGKRPGALDGLTQTAVPLPPAEVTVADPAALLARRPDVMAAERQLAAATSAIGIAESMRFPSVSLMGLIGIGGSSAGNDSGGGELATAALPRLSWSFLDFGRIKAAVSGAEAARDAALAEYEASVLGALRDAEAALARFGAARTTYVGAGTIAAEGVEAARMQVMRADAGAIPQGEAIDARIGATDAQLAQVNDKAALTLAYVTLAKALGLGWQPVTEDKAP